MNEKSWSGKGGLNRRLCPALFVFAADKPGAEWFFNRPPLSSEKERKRAVRGFSWAAARDNQVGSRAVAAE